MLGRHLPWRAHGTVWPSTNGTVLSASVQVGTAGATRTEHPLVYYAYQVDGQLFQGHRVRFAGSPWQATAVVDHCPAGSPVTVFYDPADPSSSTLEL
jgi:hypothetical protein